MQLLGLARYQRFVSLRTTSTSLFTVWSNNVTFAISTDFPFLLFTSFNCWLIYDKRFLVPGTLPLIRDNVLFQNNLYNFKVLDWPRFLPMRPTRFLPLNTRLGATGPIEPGRRGNENREPWDHVIDHGVLITP